MRIAVIGLGKIGLPLAAQYASRGHDVVGVDVNASTVDLVNRAVEPFPGEAGLQERLPALVSSGRLRATREYADAIPTADAVVVVVPLVVDDADAPDFSLLDSATTSIGSHLTAGTLVLYETTLPVGTTRDRWRPMLEQRSGLREGVDFHVGFSPERVLTGRVFEDLRKYPKLIGCLDDEGARLATAFYAAALEFDDRPDLPQPNGVWDLGAPEAAELTKLAETTYRDVNIALANQFARHAETIGIDVYRVIDAANSQPYSHIHRPGVSVGGHCIPVYPRLYLSGDPDATVVRAAREANAVMPEHVVDLLEKSYGNLTSARVVVLGAAYRAGVKEVAFSGAFPLVDLLRQRGAETSVHDPLFDAGELGALGFTPHVLGTQVDAAILHTDHGPYLKLGSADLPGARVIVDGRGLLDKAQFMPGTTVVRLGRAETE